MKNNQFVVFVWKTFTKITEFDNLIVDMSFTSNVLHSGYNRTANVHTAEIHYPKQFERFERKKRSSNVMVLLKMSL